MDMWRMRSTVSLLSILLATLTNALTLRGATTLPIVLKVLTVPLVPTLFPSPTLEVVEAQAVVPTQHTMGVAGVSEADSRDTRIQGAGASEEAEVVEDRGDGDGRRRVGAAEGIGTPTVTMTVAHLSL